MKLFFPLFLISGISLVLHAEAPSLSWMTLDTNGQFKIGPVSSGLLLQTAGFRQTARENTVNCRLLEHPGTLELDTTWYRCDFIPFPEEKPIRIDKRLTVHGTDAANWRYTVQLPEARELARLAMAFKLPADDFKNRTLQIDGKALRLPEKYQKVHLFTGKAGELQLPLPGSMLRFSGKLSLIIQDQRIWNMDSFSLLILFNPPAGRFLRAELEFDLSCRTTRLSAEQLRSMERHFVPLDLSGVANNTLTDRIAGDGEGGWTDQGGENDLRCFRFEGRNRFKAIPFDIARRPRNVVSVGGRNWKQLPRQLSIPVGDQRAGGIYFLHTSAWPCPEVGSYEVNYTDGSAVSIPIRNLNEIFNWTVAGFAERAMPGWSGKNTAREVFLTLFAWPNPHPEKTIRSLTMRAGNSDQVFFSLLGLTLTKQYPFLLDEMPEMTADVDDSAWTTLSEIDEKAASGSAIDVSALVPAPAGKFGPVRVEREGFVFADGRKARFLGVNFELGSCFPDKEAIHFHAARLRRLGINAVRFHKYDLLRGNERSLFLNDPDSPEFHRENLDRMFYALAELKKNGLYWCMDLLTARQVKRCDYPEFSGETFYTYSIFMPRLIELQKQFITRLFTARNPYTGKTIGEDPALVMLLIQNEDSLLYQPNRNRIRHPLALAELKRQFNEYLRKKYPTRQELAVAWNGSLKAGEDPVAGSVELPMNPAGCGFSETRQADMRLFYFETQCRYYRIIRDHVRSLGITAPVAGSNHWTGDLLDLRANAELDFVDRHSYWAHPTVVDGWAFDQVLFNPLPMVKSPSGGLIGNLAARRIAGKPFAVTEWNDGSTNEFRADAQLLLPVYASMHEWQLFQFSYSPLGTDGKFVRPMVYSFGMNDDPVQLSLLPVSAVCFHRGDAADTGGRLFRMVTDQQLADPGFSLDREEIAAASLRGKAGIAFAQDACELNADAPRALSWDARLGHCRIDTDKTQGFAGFPGKEPIRCRDVQLQLIGDFAVAVVTSLDHEPLKKSRRMLLSAIARGWNKGMKFNPLRNRITVRGTLPRVMQPVTGRIKLLRPGKGLAVHALDYSGRRLTAPNIIEESDGVVVELTGAPHYELIFAD